MKKIFILLLIINFIFAMSLQDLYILNNKLVAQSFIANPVNEYIATSSDLNYKPKESLINIPTILCFETSTNSSLTNCRNIPGEGGMIGVCSEPGCYDRAKFEISNDNPQNTRYAIQIATNPEFTTGVQYISGSNRFPKSTLTINDFLYKCEWEGITDSNYCVSSNITYQKYNIIGLTPDTLYYLRVAALESATNQIEYTKTNWSPSVTAATQNSRLTIDINTTNNYITFKTTTNSLNGMSLIANKNSNISVDLLKLTNDSTKNLQGSSEYIGSISIPELTIDYKNTNSYAIFHSNSLPLLNAEARFKLDIETEFNNHFNIQNSILTAIPLTND